MQLRHKFFIVLSLLSGVPLLILLFGVVDQMEQEVTARTRAEMHGTLDKMAGEIELILNNQKAIARGLARVPAVREFASIAADPRHPEYTRYADRLEQFFLNYQHSVPAIQALRFIDRNGHTLVKVKEGKPVEPKRVDEDTGRLFIADQSNRSFFKKAIRADDDIYMSNFELGQVAQGADFCPAMVRYSVPILDEVANLEGVLVVNMWGQRLDKTIEAALGGHDVNAYIVEMDWGGPRDGIYLYHRDNDKRFANQLGSDYRLSRELTEAEWQRIHESVDYGSLFRDDGRMLFYRKINPYPDRLNQWLLVLETDRASVYAPIIRMRTSIWLLLGVLLLASLLTAIWASGRLTGPVHRLAGIIRRYADGDRSARYESQSRRSDEVEQAGIAFNYLAQRLEETEKERESAVRAACQSERLAALGQMAAGIGHEINNPLMNIMSLASLVEESLRPDQQSLREDLEILKKEGQRCARIVQGILSFAREKEPTYEAFDMHRLIDDTLELLSHRLQSSGITVEKSLDASLPMEGDPNLLQQVLVNILLNAIQASPEGSVIHVHGRLRDGEVEIEITDNGSGIASEDSSKIFDPFFTTKREGEGTGLGLSISYGIVKRHQGRLWIENTPEGGARVYMRLPVKSARDKDVMQEVEEMLNAG